MELVKAICDVVKEKNLAKYTEYDSRDDVINFEIEAINRNFLKDTLLIPAPTQIISSGNIGMINIKVKIIVSFFLTYSWYFFNCLSLTNFETNLSPPILAKKYIMTIPKVEPKNPINAPENDPITALPAGIVSASGKGKKIGWNKQIKKNNNFAVVIWLVNIRSTPYVSTNTRNWLA